MEFPFKVGFANSAAAYQLCKYSSPFVSHCSQQRITHLIVLLSTLNQQARLIINGRTLHFSKIRAFILE